MHLLVLTPDPAFPEPFAWAFHVQAEALRAAGAEVTSRPWTAGGDLSPFDLVLPLVAWGYHLRYDEWLKLLDRFEAEGTPVANPPALLRWNSDKAYLAELGDKGVPTVPTLEVDHLNEAALAAAFGTLGTHEVVVKPPVSAGASGTYRLREGEGAAVPEEVHGQRMMIQPFLASIADTGEYSLILFGGEPSHCVVKRPKSGDFRVQPNFGGETVACEPPTGALDLARAALSCAPAEAVYAGRHGCRRQRSAADHRTGADRTGAVPALRRRGEAALCQSNPVSRRALGRIAIGGWPKSGWAAPAPSSVPRRSRPPARSPGVRHRSPQSPAHSRRSAPG